MRRDNVLKIGIQRFEKMPVRYETGGAVLEHKFRKKSDTNQKVAL